MNESFAIAGKTYRVGSMETRKQFHVARRLHPIVLAIATEVEKLPNLKLLSGDEHKEERESLLQQAWGMGVAAAFSTMADEQVDFILDGCLDVVLRQDDASKQWVKIIAKGGGFMFADIDRGVMIQLILAVIGELKLMDFFGDRPAASKSAAQG